MRRRLKPWMLVAALWIAPAVLAAVDAIAQSRLHGDPWPSAQDLLFSGGDWLIYAFITPIIFAIVHRWPIVRPRIWQRTLFHLAIPVSRRLRAEFVAAVRRNR